MKEVREGVVSNNSMNNSNNQEMEALKNQLRMANEAKEEVGSRLKYFCYSLLFLSLGPVYTDVYGRT